MGRQAPSIALFRSLFPQLAAGWRPYPPGPYHDTTPGRGCL